MVVNLAIKSFKALILLGLIINRLHCREPKIDEQGTCDLVLTYIDLDAVFEGLDDGYDADELTDAILAKKAPTQEEDISFDLEYDSDEEEWIITDTTALADLLAIPFEDISFTPDYGDPVNTIDAFLLALANVDLDAIDALSPYATSENFTGFGDDAVIIGLYYSSISYEVIGNPVARDETATVDLTLTLPDAQAIANDVFLDTDFMGSLMKDYVLAIILELDTTQYEEDLLAGLYTEIMGFLAIHIIYILRIRILISRSMPIPESGLYPLFHMNCMILFWIRRKWIKDT